MKTLHNRFLKFALLAFIATRALTPAGFMPNALSSGLPFILCNGNPDSLQILALLDHHHSHHNHSPGQSEQFADNTCGFSVLNQTVCINKTDAVFIEAPDFLVLAQFVLGQNAPSFRYHRPPLRAPPRTVV